MSKRIALVTGGTGGIGTSICQELFTQGFTVVAGYNSGGNHDKAVWYSCLRLDFFTSGQRIGFLTKIVCAVWQRP